jgi:FkbM family methyltransferase
LNRLYLKHRLVVSPLSAQLLALREFLTNVRTYWRHPELALLRREDAMMRTELARLLHPDSVCVDVGAHIGSMTNLFRRCAPDGRHVLIEASPTKAAWLRKAFPTYTVHQLAVSDTEGEVSFFENLDQPGFSSLINRTTRGRTSQIVMPCTTLDNLLADHSRIDLIKIDVEGLEYSVVKGARDVLKRCRPVLLFEAGAAADKDIDNESYAALFRLLTDELGYEIFPVFGLHFNRAPITEREFMGYRTYPFMAFNFFACPKV